MTPADMPRQTGSAPSPARRPSSPQFADGLVLRSALAGALKAVEANQETINALNVFPVPDGDTGTNMALTLRSTIEDTATGATAHAGQALSAMARAALLGARGNSGLILAQFFKGMASVTAGSAVLGPVEFANGMRAAATSSYASMPDPKEGTLLTVFRECAQAAEQAADPAVALADVWRAALEQSRDTVARTPAMLQVLREAGVVDSGGYGFMVMLEGGLAALEGSRPSGVTVPVPEARVDGVALSGRVSVSFTSQAAEEVWGYCTSFAIAGTGLDADQVRKRLTGEGKSVVVAGDSNVLKVHVHVLDPGGPLSYGASLGTVSNVEVKNMDEQARRQAALWAGASAAAGSERQVAVVAVVAGEGMRRVYESAGLGACTTLTGGDTMNPSTAELLKAVEDAASDQVLLLPNNKNVIGTANQVAALSKKKVAVVAAKSQQAGVGALLAFRPEAGLETNASAMAEAASGVRAGAVSRATRSVTLNGRKVVRGQYIGVMDDRVEAVAETPERALAEMVVDNARDATLVTLYSGAATSQDAAEAAAAELRAALPGADVEVVPGGQPHQQYLVAIE
jgi:hypothetical protein